MSAATATAPRPTRLVIRKRGALEFQPLVLASVAALRRRYPALILSLLAALLLLALGRRAGGQCHIEAQSLRRRHCQGRIAQHGPQTDVTLRKVIAQPAQI